MNEDLEHSIVDFGDLLTNGSHEDILEFLRDRQLELGKFGFKVL